MSTILCIFIIILVGFMIFSLCSNLIYWYENLNTRHTRLEMPKPGIFLCIRKYLLSLGGYILCVALFPAGPLLRSRPKPFPVADGAVLPPIVLVHGLNNNAAVWLFLGARLRKAGYPVSTYSYSSLFVPLEKIIDKLDAHMHTVEKFSDGRKPILIGHSLGGLLIRKWLSRHDNIVRVQGVVTLGTPHRGSKLAVFAPGALARHLVPGSPLLRQLAKAPSLPFPCTSLVSTFDEAVLPPFRLLPPKGWSLRLAAPVGHFSMLFSPFTANVLMEELAGMVAGTDIPMSR